MKYIFKTAQMLLTPKEIDNWIYFAYGVMENGIEGLGDDAILSIDEQKRSIQSTLLKGISQEVDARESN